MADPAAAAKDFRVPVPCIATEAHIDVFRRSQACAKLRGFISALSDAVKGKANTDVVPVSDTIRGLVAILDELDVLVNETPPVQADQRFGNPAFKTWHGRMSDRAPDLVARILPPAARLAGAEKELTPYLLDSFGNATRIDYGSGHELAFVAFLCCLGLINAFGEADMPALVTVVFRRYLDLVRKIQMTYKHEPAGSRGVWGLDDHQFLCYYWGAAQLIGNPQGVEPGDIIVERSVRENADRYLFFGAVAHIRKVKSGPFHEHSRYLYDMSAVGDWTRVNKGLLKMFDAEVLFKVPVIQHFMFGSLLEIDLAPRAHAVANDSTGKFPNEEAPWAGHRGGGAGGGAAGVMPMTAAPWAKKPHT